MNQLSADRAASLAAGQQFAGLGAQQQQLGLDGLGALDTVGGTQQAQQQQLIQSLGPAALGSKLLDPKNNAQAQQLTEETNANQEA